MDPDFLRREWGAVAFLVATALGIVVVPVGLNLAKHNAPPVTTASLPTPSASVSPSASPSPVLSPSPSAAAPSPSPSAAPTPSAVPSAAPATPSPSPS